MKEQALDYQIIPGRQSWPWQTKPLSHLDKSITNTKATGTLKITDQFPRMKFSQVHHCTGVYKSHSCLEHSVLAYLENTYSPNTFFLQLFFSS